MEAYTVLWAVVIGYLVGSISFSRLVSRMLRPGEDLAQVDIPVPGTDESYKVMSIGAATAAGEHGSKVGMLVSLLDILKVALPVLAFRLLYPDQPYELLAAVAGLVGHVWPVFYRFKGGSGYSAILGGLLVIDWPAAILTPIIGWTLGLLVFRNLLVANFLWLWLLVPWMALRGLGQAGVGYAIAVNVIFVLAMIPQARLAYKYYRQGQIENYGMSYMESNPMGRGMLKLARRFHVEVKL